VFHLNAHFEWQDEINLRQSIRESCFEIVTLSHFVIAADREDFFLRRELQHQRGSSLFNHQKHKTG